MSHCILSPIYLIYAEYIMQNAGLDESQVGINQLLGEISATSDTQMIPLYW